MNTSPKHLSPKLRAYRQMLGLTQKQFAARANIGYKYYQRVESGEQNNISLEKLDLIAQALGLSGWQLISPEEFPKLKSAPPPEEDLKVAEDPPSKKRKNTAGKRS